MAQPEPQEQVREMRGSRGYKGKTPADHIGCIIIVQPVFFSSDAWVSQPTNWSPHNQANQRYDLMTGEGARIWAECRERVSNGLTVGEAADPLVGRDGSGRCGAPQLVRPRLGQGAFRVAVTDAYDRVCAATGEHALPALEASHIRPYAEPDNGPHEVSNGLLLRADLHRLFDKGYMTVTPEHRIEVSPRLRQDYSNGHTCYPHHGKILSVPSTVSDHPAPEWLRWHNEHKFLT